MSEFSNDQGHDPFTDQDNNADEWRQLLAESNLTAVRKKTRGSIKSGEYGRLPMELKKQISKFLFDHSNRTTEIPPGEIGGRIIMAYSGKLELPPSLPGVIEGDLLNSPIESGKPVRCGDVTLPTVQKIIKSKEGLWHFFVEGGYVYQVEKIKGGHSKKDRAKSEPEIKLGDSDDEEIIDLDFIND